LVEDGCDAREVLLPHLLAGKLDELVRLARLERRVQLAQATGQLDELRDGQVRA
jgi:hypothetical protein